MDTLIIVGAVVKQVKKNTETIQISKIDMYFSMLVCVWLGIVLSILYSAYNDLKK